MATQISNPFPRYYNLRGDLLDGGYIYIGTANNDPEASPLDVYVDEDLTIPIVQPLRTRGGYIVNGASPVRVFIAEDDYSIAVKDGDGSAVYSARSTKVVSTAFQPADSDLTAIAALATTEFGRGLLTLANATALKAATGIPDALPLTGGTVTGSVLRGSAGAHLYNADPAAADGRVIVTDAGAAAPTAGDGAYWFKKKT